VNEGLEMTLGTPALLFPAISLLLLAYTNRFLALASLVRALHSRYRENPEVVLRDQIDNLRTRVLLIRNMQALGVASMLLCVLSMFLLFAGLTFAAKYVFGASLLLMIGSLALSVHEIHISTRALDLQLSDLRGVNPR
jgi:hypothetical protein